MASVRQQIESDYSLSVLKKLLIVEAGMNSLAPKGRYNQGVKDKVMTQASKIRDRLREIDIYRKAGADDLLPKHTHWVEREFGRMMVRLKLLVEANV
jgi:hypothetical protein